MALPPVVNRPRLTVRGLRSPLAGPFALHLDAGACVIVDGASGSGKSLFLRMIADLDPSEGEVLLDNAPRDRFSGPEWRRRVVYVAAESGWWRDAVLDHFPPGQHIEIRDLAARLGVDPAAVDGPVARLSTGERQRMALIRGFLLNPPVMLLDEPTGPLDPLATLRVEDLIRERLANGASIILVSHDGGQAERLGAGRYHMADRRLEPVS